MHNLRISIRSKKPEPGQDPKQIISLEKFLDLLREEEDYYPGEQDRTKIMITRLRKIFYDQWGWDKYLIRGAKNVKGRYVTKVVGAPVDGSFTKPGFTKHHPAPKHRIVSYSDHDRVYGASRAGQVPPIMNNNWQAVTLPDGDFCHVAHILGGLDAYNHQQIASPLPSWLLFLAKLGPHCDSNVALVTWLDDIGQALTNFVFDYRKFKKPLSTEREQQLLDGGATGADMLSDIDAYVIARRYNIAAAQGGQRVTDILRDYYFSDSPEAFRRKRCTTFCEMIGLTGWDGTHFANEKDWIRYNRKQLRDATTFQIFSETAQKLKSIWIPLLVWLNFYRKILKTEEILEVFLAALKEQIRQENA